MIINTTLLVTLLVVFYICSVVTVVYNKRLRFIFSLFMVLVGLWGAMMLYNGPSPAHTVDLNDPTSEGCAQ